MKKVILSIALFIQFTYGMEKEIADLSNTRNTMALVPVSFFDECTQRISNCLEIAVRNITEGRSTSEAAIVSVDENCQDLFSVVRLRVNQIFFERIREQQTSQEIKIQRIIEEKDREIQVLQERLDVLLSHSSSKIASSLRGFDIQRQQAEDDTKHARERAIVTTVPELCTEDEITERISHFSAQLNQMRREVLEGQRSLERAFERTQDRYDDSVRGLVHDLERRYKIDRSRLAEQFDEKVTHMEEAYERQIALMQRMIDEVTATQQLAEQEERRKTEINRICRGNDLNPIRDMISINAATLCIKPLLEREKEIKQINNRQFNAFKELLIANDSENQTYFDSINQYIRNISTDQLQHPGDPWPDGNCYYHYNWDYTGAIHEQHWDFLVRNGGSAGCSRIWNERGGNHGWYAIQRGIGIAQTNYSRKLSAYNAGIEQRAQIPFPRAEFDKLSDQINALFRTVQ